MSITLLNMLQSSQLLRWKNILSLVTELGASYWEKKNPNCRPKQKIKDKMIILETSPLQRLLHKTTITRVIGAAKTLPGDISSYSVLLNTLVWSLGL